MANLNPTLIRGTLVTTTDIYSNGWIYGPSASINVIYGNEIHIDGNVNATHFNGELKGTAENADYTKINLGSSSGRYYMTGIGGNNTGYHTPFVLPNFYIDGTTLVAPSFSGNGHDLSFLNASNITSGCLPATVFAISGKTAFGTTSGSLPVTIGGSTTASTNINGKVINLNANVNVSGNLTVTGSTTFLNAENISAKDLLIELGSGERVTNGTAITNYAGLFVQKYDGTNSGALVFDKNGTAYVGDVKVNSDGTLSSACTSATGSASGLQPLATRSTALSNGNIVKWDNTNKTLVSAVSGTDYITSTGTIDNSNKVLISNTPASGYLTVVSSSDGGKYVSPGKSNVSINSNNALVATGGLVAGNTSITNTNITMGNSSQVNIESTGAATFSGKVTAAGGFNGSLTGTASNASSLNSKAPSYYLDYNNFTNTPTIPEPTDYYWANVKVAKTSSQTTSPTFSPSFSVSVKTNDSLAPGIAWGWASPIAKYLWHDLLAFGANGIPTFETSADGTTYTANTSETYTKKPFISKENNSVETVSDTIKSVRWTWTSGSFHACNANYLVIGYCWTGTRAKIKITLQAANKSFASASAVTEWVTLFEKASDSTNSAPIWYKIDPSFSNVKYLRLTFTKLDGSSGTAPIAAIKLLTYRWGNQGLGSEYEYPYTWDENGNIYNRFSGQELGRSENRWPYIYGATVNATTIYENGTALTSKYLGINATAVSANYAASAGKLTTDAGSTTLPVYFSNGVAVNTSTTLGVCITGKSAKADSIKIGDAGAGGTYYLVGTSIGYNEPNTYGDEINMDGVKISYNGSKVPTLDISGNISFNGNMNFSGITISRLTNNALYFSPASNSHYAYIPTKVYSASANSLPSGTTSTNSVLIKFSGGEFVPATAGSDYIAPGNTIPATGIYADTHVSTDKLNHTLNSVSTQSTIAFLPFWRFNGDTEGTNLNFKLHPYLDSNSFTYNTTTNALTVNTNTGTPYYDIANKKLVASFSGSLSGNATSATSATTASKVIISNVSQTKSYLLMGTASTSSSASVYANTGVTYNPASKVLVAPTFSGSFSGTATNATCLNGQAASYYATAAAVSTISGKVTAIEELINADGTGDTIINKVNEVITAFASVSEDFNVYSNVGTNLEVSGSTVTLKSLGGKSLGSGSINNVANATAATNDSSGNNISGTYLPRVHSVDASGNFVCDAEFNKSINFSGGDNGKYLCVGKFNLYDSNVTIYFDCTDNNTYHGELLIATQNVGASNPSLKATVYGDATNSIAPNIYIDHVVGVSKVGVYFKPNNYSKNLIHIRGIGWKSSASDICTKVSAAAVPSTATIKPTNGIYSDTLTKVSATAGNGTYYLLGAASTGSAQTVYANTNIYMCNGTLVLSKATDLSGTANNGPALIVGGTVGAAHIEFDGNEIHAKTNTNAAASLHLNNEGGAVYAKTLNSTTFTATSVTSSTVTATTVSATTGTFSGTISAATVSATTVNSTTNSTKTYNIRYSSNTNTACTFSYDEGEECIVYSFT